MSARILSSHLQRLHSEHRLVNSAQAESHQTRAVLINPPEIHQELYMHATGNLNSRGRVTIILAVSSEWPWFLSPIQILNPRLMVSFSCPYN
jgi:hypothetical protein